MNYHGLIGLPLLCMAKDICVVAPSQLVHADDQAVVAVVASVHIECSFQKDLQYPPKESIHLWQSQVLTIKLVQTGPSLILTLGKLPLQTTCCPYGVVEPRLGLWELLNQVLRFF